MTNYLNDAIRLLSLADGREGPIGAEHATQLVIARALIAIAEELRRMNDRLDAESDAAEARQEREDMIRLYSNQ